MDISGLGAIASFAYSSALRSGLGQSRAVEQAFQAAASAGEIASTLFDNASPDTSILDNSYRGSLAEASYALARRNGSASSFAQSLLSGFAVDSLGSMGAQGLEYLNPQVAAAAAAYQYHRALASGQGQAFIRQMTGNALDQVV